LNIGAPGRIRTHDPLVRSFEINQPAICFLKYFRYVLCSMFAHPCPTAFKKSRKGRARTICPSPYFDAPMHSPRRRSTANQLAQIVSRNVRECEDGCAGDSDCLQRRLAKRAKRCSSRRSIIWQMAHWRARAQNEPQQHGRV